jgi:hypothetical protein
MQIHTPGPTTCRAVSRRSHARTLGLAHTYANCCSNDMKQGYLRVLTAARWADVERVAANAKAGRAGGRRR